MGILFISHSSRNNEAAIMVRDWLREQGWRDVFLDLDPEQGLAPGQRAASATLRRLLPSSDRSSDPASP